MNCLDGLVLCSGCAALAVCHITAEQRTAASDFVILADDDTGDDGQLTSSICVLRTHPRFVAPTKQRYVTRQSQGSIFGNPVADNSEWFGTAHMIESKEEETSMKTKRLLFITCV